MAKKIKGTGNLVILHGDEMAQVAFAAILDRFVKNRTEVKLHEIDLSAKNRLKTNGKVVKQAIDALVKYGVGVKNAGITVNKSQLSNFIKELQGEGIKIDEKKLDGLATKSPNGAIRKGIGGNILREDIPFANISRHLPEWKNRDISVLTMEEGGLKNSFNDQAEKSGKLILSFKSKSMKNKELHVRPIQKGDVYLLATVSIQKIKQWAELFFSRCLEENRPAYMALKDTVMPGYDGVIKEAVEDIFKSKYAKPFAAQKLTYEYGLIDAQAASMVVNPPTKALWGIPDNNTGRKMLKMVEALKTYGLPERTVSLGVSRMSAGGGDQYGSFNAPAEADGVLTLSIGRKVLHTRKVKKGDPILLMTNNPADMKAWAEQTFAEAAQKGQEIYFGLKREYMKYDAVMHDKIEETYYELAQDGNVPPPYMVMTPSQQLVKMVSDPARVACYASLNMDGDIFSDIAAALGGSLATASSVIASPDGKTLFEAPHGTAPDLYRQYVESKGSKAFFNPSALIYAVASALEIVASKQPKKDREGLQTYAKHLKEALIRTVEAGNITPDIKGQTTQPEQEKILGLFEFLDAVEQRLAI